MTREKARQLIDELLAKSSLDQQLREALSTLMDELVVTQRKADLFEKALKEDEDRSRALELDLGIRDGVVTPLRRSGDASVSVVGVSANGGTMG
jgi:hypothetical protein